MSSTDDLKEAFAGESQANRKYLAFARKAEAEGRKQIAKLFRAAAEAETVHAHAHLAALGGIKSTDENLQAAIAGEGFEFEQMYPKFLADAQAEGNRAAVASFRNALAVERIHHGLYTQALRAHRADQDLPAGPVWVCPVCGNTVCGDVPDPCGVCGVAGSRFFEVK